MSFFIDQHFKLLKHLIDEEVAFLVIGGYAVIFYGYGRTTGDFDIWLKPDNLNKNKVIKALEKEEISEVSLNEIAQMDFNRHLMFSLGEQPEKVDFLTFINQVPFNEADEKKVVVEINGLKVPFIHLNHLILSKINTGRMQDKADIEELQKIMQQRKQ